MNLREWLDGPGVSFQIDVDGQPKWTVVIHRRAVIDLAAVTFYFGILLGVGLHMTEMAFTFIWGLVNYLMSGF